MTHQSDITKNRTSFWLWWKHKMRNYSNVKGATGIAGRSLPEFDNNLSFFLYTVCLVYGGALKKKVIIHVCTSEFVFRQPTWFDHVFIRIWNKPTLWINVFSGMIYRHNSKIYVWCKNKRAHPGWSVVVFLLWHKSLC